MEIFNIGMFGDATTDEIFSSMNKMNTDFPTLSEAKKASQKKVHHIFKPVQKSAWKSLSLGNRDLPGRNKQGDIFL